jgi:hypothetical protein
VQELRQEYTKKDILFFALSESSNNTSKVAKANQALLMRSMQEECVQYVPLYAPDQSDLDSNSWSANLEPRFDTMYQRSGFLAAAIESVTLPLRVKNFGEQELGNFSQALDYNSNLTCGLSLGFPIFSEKYGNSDFLGFQEDGSVPWARDLTLQATSNVNSFSSFIFR